MNATAENQFETSKCLSGSTRTESFAPLGNDGSKRIVFEEPLLVKFELTFGVVHRRRASDKGHVWVDLVPETRGLERGDFSPCRLDNLPGHDKIELAATHR